ncbi:Fucose permease [Deinococcus reticulitermitis]|uniref:Fucose permease n=1 Tax=Deinococcus reticulitermitis TaxID=856736 RepID=A0A1H6XL54_9DEIO|nr:MFS transporter [Deinococcus reticulitermitis]SEJ25295.1 Fucose permease [Deinococcus reticulitermitis]
MPESLPLPAAAPPLTLALLGAGTVSFFTLGVLQAAYGPAFPGFQARYGVGLGEVALIASLHFLGSAAAPPIVGLLLTRLSLRRVVVGSLILLGGGALLVAAAPLWGVALAAALLAGLGLGGVSGALNAAYASVGTRAINVVNSVFGVGSMLAPLIVAAGLGGSAPGGPTGGLGLALPFGVIAALSALSLLAAGRWGLPALAPPPRMAGEARPGPLLVLFAAILLTYVGLEVGAGAWAGKYLSTLGVQNAAVVVSAFWGGITVSRVLVGLMGARLVPARVVSASAFLTVLAAALSALPGFASPAFVLLGLACGPIFPTALAWVAQLVPARLVPFLLVAGSTGGIVMPALIGWAFAAWGPGAVPGILTGGAALLCALVLLAWRLGRRGAQS